MAKECVLIISIGKLSAGGLHSVIGIIEHARF